MCNCGGAGWLQAANGGLVRCACNPAKSKPVPPNPVHPERERSEQSKDAEARRQKEAFYAWLNLNRHVFLAYEKSALELLAQGETRIGSKKILENMRGHVASIGGAYEIDNTLSPWLAREAIKRHPELKSLIETRASLADVLLDAAKAVPA